MGELVYTTDGKHENKSEFYRVLDRIPKSKIDEKVRYFQRNSQAFYKLAKKYYEKNPNATEEEINDYFIGLFNKRADLIFKLVSSNNKNERITTFRTDTLIYNTYVELLENPKLMESTYEKYKKDLPEYYKIETEKEKIKYLEDLFNQKIVSLNKSLASDNRKNLSSERERSLLKFYKYLLENPEMMKQVYELEIDDEKVPKNSKVGNTKEEIIKYIVFKKISNLSNFERFKESLKYEKEELEKGLKSSCIASLRYLGKELQNFGLLQEYCQNQNRMFEPSRLGGLAYSEDEVSNFFNGDTLANYDINTLLTLNSFWVNRYSKDLEKMNEAYIVATSLRLWNKIKEAKSNEKTGNIEVPIDENDLYYALEKASFIDIIHNAITKKVDIEKDGKIDENNPNKAEVDIANIFNENYYTYKEEYHKHYQEKLPNAYYKNDYKAETLYSNDLRVLKQNIYRLKNMSIIAILSSLYSSNISENWGIILKDKTNKDPNKILLGVDIKGLNMPLRLHVDKESILEFITESQNTELLPVYEGIEDFKLQENYVSTQVLMPMGRKQRTELRKIIKGDKRKQPNKSNKANKSNESNTPNIFHIQNIYIQHFTNHIESLCSKSLALPRHLLREGYDKLKNGGVKRVLKKPPTKYYNLRTQEIFIKNENGELEPEGDGR